MIGALPQGDETPLGRWFADGQELSIGQWQKVALARAFMRNADLLILDEPTASLAVLISHRFSTVRMASRIVVIKDGSYDELLLRGGRYAEWFDLQAASYR